MKKIEFGPATSAFPVATVLVSSQFGAERNLVTIAWTGFMNSQPPMVYIGVNPLRHSHHLIKEAGEFVINVPAVAMAEVVDYCGLVSGRNVDKFLETGLTPVPATYVQAPLIQECPINLECRVTQVVVLKSHDVFIAEVLAVHYNEDVLNDQGKPDLTKIHPYAYFGHEYWEVGPRVGSHGFSRKSKYLPLIMQLLAECL